VLGYDRTLARGEEAVVRLRPRSWTLSIFLVALTLRLGFVLLYPEFPLGRDDAFGYDRLGWNLASGRGFVGPSPEASRQSPDVPEVRVGPVYPAFLALVYLTAGHRTHAVRILQAVLSAMVVLLLYPAVRDVLGAEVARISGVLVAIYPAFVIYPGVLLMETVFLFLLTLLVRLLIDAVRSDWSWRWLATGGVMGLTVLLREESLAMLPVFAILVASHVRDRQRWMRGLSLFLLVTALTVGVWTARNYRVFEAFVPVTARGGETLWISAKGWTEWRYEDAELQSLIRGRNYIERDTAFRRQALQTILDRPLAYLALCARRVYQFWIGSHTTYLVGFEKSFGRYYTEMAFGRFFGKIALLGVNVGLVVLGLWGAFLIVKARRGGLVLFFLAPIAVIMTVHLFLFATSRYSVPIMGFVLVFAAAALHRLGVVPGWIGVGRAKLLRWGYQA
jgi:4-amino-4-deoxy-L-arabinose transferase-like glycosyltransferase